MATRSNLRVRLAAGLLLVVAMAGCRADAPSPTAAPAAPPADATAPLQRTVVPAVAAAPTAGAQPTGAPAAQPTAVSAAAAQPTAVSAAAAQADFQRPDVAPLAPAGRFQVVSQTPWPGEKVRVFFLGAQF